ncbi:MAG: hypothetical protein AAEJ47_07500 [Planctomycetota bacterium]|nr:hypothetical protein [Planctomycetota bacterium]
MKQFIFALVLASLAWLSLVANSAMAATPADEYRLGAPVRLEANGVPIDVTIGHAAPYVIDFDGDGVRDLLVGEFGKGAFPKKRLPERLREKDMGFDEGKLRIYRNIGTNAKPLFKDFEYLRAGREYASIPTT